MDGEPPEVPIQADVVTPKVVPLFGKSYELKSIKADMVIPVGGGMYLAMNLPSV